MAIVCYVPLLLTHRGKVGADTKTYLYLDPAKLLSKAPYLWDPSIGLGTVTHQNIGYLFPMGPYYWAMERLALPDWVAQRIWMGSILFLAGLGVRYLLRTLRWDGAGATVASFAYALSPYSLHYIYKHSVILLPFTALPWLLALTARSLRQPGWRHPAWFALVALAAGGVNATSLLLVLIGPGLWVLHAVFVEREITIRAALGPLSRIGLLTVATSLWWVAGLSLQGRFGIDILRYTETYRTVSQASSASEISRGLGYWFFYGTDRLGPWFKAAVTLTQNVPALTLTFAIPILGVAAALWTRFRYRVFFASMALAGLIVSVGAHPFDSPTPYGIVFKAFTESSSGLALRSTPRAMPLLALGMAVFLGGGVAALARWRPRRRIVLADLALLLIIANLSPLWMGRMVDPVLERNEHVPSYWAAAGKELDRGDRATRALEIPGIDFANYRWGATVDPITPGLTDRDFAARELVPYGSPASADLMNAIDAPFQDGSFDPSSYGALLRVLGVGDVILRSDTQFERFATPRPRPMARWLRQVDGLSTPIPFGPVMPHKGPGAAPFVDDADLSSPATLTDPHAVTIYPVDGTPPIVRSVAPQRPLIVAGSGAGLVSTAEAGLLPTDRMVVYSGSVSNDPAAMKRLLDQGAELVVTDTNRKAARRWGSTTDNDGYLEMADETPPVDVSDNRIDLFGRDTSTQTVSEQTGGLQVTASAYGNPFTYTASDRAANAADGDPTTEWKVGAFDDVTDEWIQARSTDGPITVDHIDLAQANHLVNRWITKVRLTFDGGRAREVTLDQTSHTGSQRIDLGATTSFRTLRITILATDKGKPARYEGLSGGGFREISIGDRHVTETVRPPTDLLGAIGHDAASHALAFVFHRRQTRGQIQIEDEERAMRREVTLPDARTFTVSGKARLSSEAPGTTIDALVRPGGTGAPTMMASSGLVHDITWRPSKALDADTTSAWQSEVNPMRGEWLDIRLAAPRVLSADSLTVMTDGRHSQPRVVHFEVDGKKLPELTITAPTRGDLGGRTTLQLPPQRLEGSDIRLVVDEFTPVTVPDRLSTHPSTLPLGIADLGLSAADGGASPIPDRLPERFDSGCRSDLLVIAGTRVPVDVSGTTTDAETGNLLDVRPCGSPTVALSAGTSLLQTIDGRSAGITIDQVALESAAATPAPEPRTAPRLRTTRDDKVGYTIHPDAATQPYWLVLGQSCNAGWTLTADGKDLGPATLVSGYANGWLVDPAKVGERPVLRLAWTPQSSVWWALLLSGLGFVVCLILAFRPAVAAVRGTKLTMSPSVISIGDAFGRGPGAVMTVIATLGAAVGGAVFVGLPWAVLFGALTVAALRTDIGWRVLRFASIGLIGIAALYVVAKQALNGYLVDFDWPKHFEAAHPVAMAGYLLLGVECVVEIIRAGWRRDAELD